MTIEEVVEDYIRETVKPLTPDQARLKALQGNVDRARLALQAARTALNAFLRQSEKD